MPKNIEQFANMMSNRMQQTATAAIPNTLELGVVNDNMSITPDNFRVPIPQGDYMIDLRMTGKQKIPKGPESEHEHTMGTHGGHTDGTGEHTHLGGQHPHNMPDEYRCLEPGDRVLIAWCGNEPVVIAIVVSS